MSLPARLDLVGDLLGVYRGDDYGLRLPFTHEGAPLALTGVWRAQYRRGGTNGEATEFGLTDSDLPGGVIVLRLTGVQTARMIPGVWDLQQTTVGGKVVTWLRGKVEVAGEVTR